MPISDEPVAASASRCAGLDLGGPGAEAAVGGLEVGGDRDRVGHGTFRCVRVCLTTLSAGYCVRPRSWHREDTDGTPTGPRWTCSPITPTPTRALLIEEVQAEYVVRYGGRDETPLDPAMFDPPRGAFFVGYRDGVPGGHRRLAAARPTSRSFGTRRTAEVKRMYVAPARRADSAWPGDAGPPRGHRRATAGAEVMILETGTAQPEAIALYESAGYTPIPSFGYYREAPLNRCYGRDLRDAAAQLSLMVALALPRFTTVPAAVPSSSVIRRAVTFSPRLSDRSVTPVWMLIRAASSAAAREPSPSGSV